MGWVGTAVVREAARAIDKTRTAPPSDAATSQLALLENEVLGLHRRLAEAEQRAAVAERIAAEEIAAKKAKAALGDTLAQAARAQKAENAALLRQVEDLKQEVGSLADSKSAAAPKSKAPAKTRKKSRASAAKKRRKAATPPPKPAAPAAKSEAEPVLVPGPEAAQTEKPSATAPVQPAAPPAHRRAGHLPLVLTMFAAILGWSLVIFDGSNSAKETPPPSADLAAPAPEAAIEKPANLAEEVPPPAPVEPSAPEVTAVRETPPPANGEMHTRSVQNERINESIKAAERAKKERAELWRRLTNLRERLTETEAKLSVAEQQTEIARLQAQRAKFALDQVKQKNQRVLDATARAGLRVEANLMAEIETLRKALAEANSRPQPTTTETE